MTDTGIKTIGLAVGAQRVQVPGVALATTASTAAAARDVDASRAEVHTLTRNHWIPIVVGLLVSMAIGCIPFLFAWDVLARHG